jgi:Methylamine utilisation protein MauE
VFSYVLVSVRCVLVLVLATSAIGKVGHPSELAEFGRTLRIGLRLPQARLVAGAWVAVEGVTAVGLALPLTVGYAAVLSAGVFGCLTVGAGLLVAQHRGFACNCFGTKQSQLSWGTVLRNGALTGAALLLVAGLRLRGAAAAPAPVLLAAVLSVLLGAVLIWQAEPLRALLRQSEVRHPAGQAVPPRSALSGGRR